jgi:RNA polymerase sigma factor (sigma-70 family)
MPDKPDIYDCAWSSMPNGKVVNTQGAWHGSVDFNRISPSLKTPAVTANVRSILKSLLPGQFRPKKAVGTVVSLMARAASSGSHAATTRRDGNEAEADSYYRNALNLALRAQKQAGEEKLHCSRLQIMLTAAGFALECGEVAEARWLLDEVSSSEGSAGFADEWTQLNDITLWKDAWLIAAIRNQNPDPLALNTLGDRYWMYLFGRCQLLTLDREKANDLAQEAWCRVLRARANLKPGGNFSSYLATIATNLWRDHYRASRRSGPLADNRMESLDASFFNDQGGQTEPLAHRIPDLKSLSPDEQTLLALDIDKALGNLTPLLREVLLARFIQGDSCAEIAKRYGRTEQTVNGWVRHSLQKMKICLERENPQKL